jgi:hypothetical protein
MNNLDTLEYPIEKWFEGEYADIPAEKQKQIREYVVNHKVPGQLLQAVIKNNLQRAVALGGEAEQLRLYVRLFYNKAPGMCHGSPQAYAEWVGYIPEPVYTVSEDYWRAPFDVIPEHMRAALERFIVEHRAPGSFLKAVILNDLRGAVNYADRENCSLIPLYVKFGQMIGLWPMSSAAYDSWLADLV